MKSLLSAGIQVHGKRKSCAAWTAAEGQEVKLANIDISQLAIDDLLVSNMHLRIYTILFDQDNPTQVAPLVYAQDTSLNGTFWNGIKIGRGNGGFLLSDGDVLKISSDVSFKFRSEESMGSPSHEGELGAMKYIESQYTITNRVLGCGAYGKVFMAIDEVQSRQLACKVVNLAALKNRLRKLELSKLPAKTNQNSMGGNMKRRRLTCRVESKLKMYDREVEILQNLRHVSVVFHIDKTAADRKQPNIIGIEKVFKTQDAMYIFQDIVTAGDLFSFLEFKNGKLLDVEAAVIVRQVTIALVYLHNQNIVHRDLKPDNVLMTSLSSGSRVVLTDFGCARYLKPNVLRMASVMGTLEYTAPEMGRRGVRSQEGYTKSVDLWSLGCLTVVLLTGGSPFSDPTSGNYSDTLAKQCNLSVLEKDEDWAVVGTRAKEFVRRLLVLNGAQRLTAEEALEHDWFTNRAHREAFEVVYEKAVQGWNPRVQTNNNILYDLRCEEGSMGEYSFWHGTSALAATASRRDISMDGISYQSYTGRRVSSSQLTPPSTPDNDQGRKVSITPSDPGFQKAGCSNRIASNSCKDREAQAPKSRAKMAGQDGKQGVMNNSNLTNRTRSRVRIPFSPGAWNKGIDEVFQAEPDGNGTSAPSKILMLPNNKTTSKARCSPTKVRSKNVESRNTISGMHPPPFFTVKSFTEHAADKEMSAGYKYNNSCEAAGLEDEVYEVVRDPVTGKRCKVRYGDSVGSYIIGSSP
ncbi:hypothetical protein FQN57_005247 [Myotisia sp. PD_48]|nr:hypothetical protein FQN57_005247 [Myotisia sp. PD_48]